MVLKQLLIVRGDKFIAHRSLLVRVLVFVFQVLCLQPVRAAACISLQPIKRFYKITKSSSIEESVKIINLMSKPEVDFSCIQALTNFFVLLISWGVKLTYNNKVPF